MPLANFQGKRASESKTGRKLANVTTHKVFKTLLSSVSLNKKKQFNAYASGTDWHVTVKLCQHLVVVLYRGEVGECPGLNLVRGCTSAQKEKRIKKRKILNFIALICANQFSVGHLHHQVKLIMSPPYFVQVRQLAADRL